MIDRDKKIDQYIHEKGRVESFYGEYRWLSNFWLVNVSLDGVVYPSVENAYQAAKTMSVEGRKPFTSCSPGQAKKIGRNMPLRAGLDEVKLGIMRDLIHQNGVKQAVEEAQA